MTENLQAIWCVFAQNLISWSDKKQNVACRSSTKAEYRSMALVGAELYCLRMLLRELDVSPSSLPILWCDDIGAVALASNPMFHARTKYVKVDYYFIREKVVNKYIQGIFLHRIKWLIFLPKAKPPCVSTICNPNVCWSMLAKMNVARYDFACTEVNGMTYAVGGYGSDGESLSSAEVYDPERNAWTLIESLRRPRYGCFACSFGGKLYVMGGRSSFTIGNSKFVDVYSPERHLWCEMKNGGCVMVTAHAVLGKQLFCMEWKNQRMLVIFDPVDNSWRKVPVPLTGSSAIGFRFGVLGGKLLFFSLEEDPGYQTLLYDPAAPAGSEWHTSKLKPSGLCLCTVTIKA